VQAGLSHGAGGVPTQARPFPTQLFGPSLISRLRRR
jgi:hypothetical protein